MKVKVGIIGVGGIGSYLSEYIDKMIQHNQLDDLEFTFFDDDKVELKNILYQNFDAGDISDYKTEALMFRYTNIHNFEKKRVGYEDLRNFDLIVLCADNNIIRKFAYKNFTTYGIPFIDARSNGRGIGIYSCETKEYLSTMDDSNESSSCQHPYQLEKKEIELGNVIVSSILAQAILNWSRRKEFPPDYVHYF